MTTKDEAEKENATIAQQWHDNLQYMGVDLVDVFQYEVRRQMGAIWKGFFDSQNQAVNREQS